MSQIICHISDLHLPIEKKPTLLQLFNKRIFGFLNHTSKRKNIFKLENLDLIFNDINKSNDIHTVLTGDIVNLSLEDEFSSASQLLDHHFTDEALSVIPGNHDAYIKVDYKRSMSYLKKYFNKQNNSIDQEPFPYLKIINDIAIIGLSSAINSPPLMCWGKMSSKQINTLEDMLKSINGNNYFTIILIHHPVHKYGFMNLKGLLNRKQLLETITKYNINLVLHGHLHREVYNFIKTKDKFVPCIGAPSSSKMLNEKISYLQYKIWKKDDKWNFSVYRRLYDNSEKKFKTQDITKSTINV